MGDPCCRPGRGRPGRGPGDRGPQGQDVGRGRPPGGPQEGPRPRRPRPRSPRGCQGPRQAPGSPLRPARVVHRGRVRKLIEALCTEHKINLIKISDPKLLGEWVGLCKHDKEGVARKIVGCSCVVVKDYGVESEALSVLLEYFASR